MTLAIIILFTIAIFSIVGGIALANYMNFFGE